MAPSCNVLKDMFGLVDTEPELSLSYGIPTTPWAAMNAIASSDCDQSMASRDSMDWITQLGFFPTDIIMGRASFMMNAPNNVSASDKAEHSSISLSPQKSMAPRDHAALDMQRYQPREPPPPRTVQGVQNTAPRKHSGKHDGAAVHVVGRSSRTCDYPGCHKVYRRNEHLKRHKQS